MNLQELAGEREALREEKRAMAEREKEINKRIAEIDETLFAFLDEQAVDRISVNGVTLSISETVVPQVLDWPAVYEYVQATNSFHLFERRMASAAYRELVAQGASIPGTEPFTKRTINMRVTR